MYKKQTLSLITIVFFLGLAFATYAEGEIFDGDKVYINNAHGYLSAEPHHRTYDGYVNFELNTYQYTGNMNVMFGFDSSNAIPKSVDVYDPKFIDVDYYYSKDLINVSHIETTTLPCSIGTGATKYQITTTNSTDVVCFDLYFQSGNDYRVHWTETKNEYVEYHNVNSVFTKYNMNLDNKNLWYYTENVSIVSGEPIKFRMYLDLINGNGKYDIAFYPSSYGSNYLQAHSDGNMILLDPTFNTSNVISYYKNDVDSATQIDSHGVNNGTVTGTTFTASGFFNGAYDYDGSDDRISYYNDGSLDFGTSNYSITAWIKLDTMATACIVCKQDGGWNENGWLFTVLGDGKLFFSNGDGGSGKAQTSDAAAIGTGSWYHIAMTLDYNNEVKLYINGTEASYSATKTNWVSSTNGISMTTGTKAELIWDTDGIIDEVGIYSKVLTSEEINQTRDTQYPFTDPGREVYVAQNDASCNDSYTKAQAKNIATPWCEFSTAVSNYACGDIITIRNGTYRDTNTFNFASSSCSEESAIQSYNNEEVIISSTYSVYESSNSEWTDNSNATHNVFVASRGSSTVLWSYNNFCINKTYFSYATSSPIMNSLDDLYNLTNPEGCFFEPVGDDFYCRFNDPAFDPNDGCMAIARNPAVQLSAMTGSRFNVTGIYFRGSTKNLYMTSGSDNVSIFNNIFFGGLKSLDLRDSSNYEVFNNYVFMNESEQWAWEDNTKTSAMETTGIYTEGGEEGIKIYNNDVYGFFNGFFALADVLGDYDSLNVSYNRFNNISDDAIEFANYCNDADIRNNNVTNSFISSSFIPVDATGQQCRVYNNVFAANKNQLWSNDGTRFYGECFKTSNANPMINFKVYKNTCIGRCIFGTLSGSQEDNNWTDNLCYSPFGGRVIDRSGLSSDGVDYDYNNYYRNDSGVIFRYWNSDTNATEFTSLATALASPSAPGDWDLNSLQVDPLFGDFANGNYSPSSTSGLCTAASDGGVIGALPCYGGAVSTCDCSSIQSGTTITESSTCQITNCDASGQDINFLCNGTIQIIGNITNHGDIIRKGISPSQKCTIITLNGGGFK